jgi:hypothetical protein
MRILKIIILFAVCVELVQLFGCSGGDVDDYRPRDKNAILGGALLNVLYPKRPDENNTYDEDSISINNISFSWDTETYIELNGGDTIFRSLNAKSFFIGIFSNKISASIEEILNVDEMVWAWHSGLGTGRNGSVLYEDGKNTENGELLDGNLRLLNSNTRYYFAIWGWDRYGELECSSMEMYFDTKE